jgi:CHAT domain-containing protein/Flp pilus assembly protein TadD
MDRVARDVQEEARFPKCTYRKDMWRGIFLAILGVAACSRRPASEVYSEAWETFHRGNLAKAKKLVDAGVQSHLSDEPGSLVPLRLLQIEILLGRGEAGAGQRLLDELPDPRDPLLHLRWLVDRADALTKLDQLSKAAALLDEVDQAAGDYATTEPVLRGQLLRGGAILGRTGHAPEGEELLKKTAALAVEVGDPYIQASALSNLAFIKFQQERYDESLDYGRPALELAEKFHFGRVAGSANNNLGMAYTILRDLDRAEEGLNKAITQLRNIGDRRNLENALGNLGNVYLLSHRSDRAAPQFEEAVKTAHEIEATADEARWAGQLSLTLIEQQNWAMAESWNRTAYALYEHLKKAENLLYLKLNTAAIASGHGNPKEAERLYRELIDARPIPYLEWNAHVRLGALLASQNRSSEASKEYMQGIDVLEHVASALLRDDHRLTYRDAQIGFFQDLVELLIKEGKNDDALRVAEYSRARLLAEKLGAQPITMDHVKTAAFQRYASRNREVLLSFWLGPKRSFVWVIKPGYIRQQELPRRSEIADSIRAYLRAIEDLRDPLEFPLPQAVRLRKMLLDPIRSDLAGASKVVVVPDGDLHALNLETLPMGDHYWIQEVEASVAPSLIVLTETQRKRPTTSSLLLVGAPVSPSTDYPDLPSARSEIEAIGRRFPGKKRLITGPQATPLGFLDSMPESYSMIHFAAHAEANQQTPLDSAIILSRRRGVYKLYARDIASLTLGADLVTISACRSAGARTYAGEGPVGFAWAFLHAGAQAVIAGLWDVSDLSSAELMERLYENLESGAKPAAALRSAKLELMGSKGPFRKPYYWAPYQTYIR